MAFFFFFVIYKFLGLFLFLFYWIDMHFPFDDFRVIKDVLITHFILNFIYIYCQSISFMKPFTAV